MSWEVRLSKGETPSERAKTSARALDFRRRAGDARQPMPEQEIEVEITLLGSDPGAPPELFRAFVQEGLPPYEERGVVEPELPVLAVGAAIGALPKVIEIILRWVGGDRRRRVKIRIGKNEIEVNQATADEQRELIDAWIRQATGSQKP